MKIMKFGGTSVGKPERMKQISTLITTQPEPTIVVLSALSGTTNALVELNDLLLSKNIDLFNNKLSTLENHYITFINTLFTKPEYVQQGLEIIKPHFDFLKITQKISFNESIQKEILAQGELLSTQIFSLYLQSISIKHAFLNALDFMKMDKNDEPDLSFITSHIHSIIEEKKENLYITQGYICKNHKSEIDNLKRGGSDYTASLLAAATNSSVCEIWTDIDGMHNNDPRIVDKTNPIENLSFDEAAELAYFGAKILHPTCIWPAQKANIPVKLLNTMEPLAKGTTISNINVLNGIKAVAAKDAITAVKIKSSRMLLAHGFLKKVFEIFEKHSISIDMITTSEVAVAVSIDNETNLTLAVDELSKLGEVEIIKNQTIIALVGNNIAMDTHFFGQLFQAINGIQLTMIDFGGSNNNISILVNMDYKKQILQQINQHIFNL